MNMNRRKAEGTQPYDQTYSLGYQVNHEDWSPFPRVNYLRQKFLDRPYEIDVERLRLVTEAYKKHEGAPRKLQCAYAFENVLLNTTLHIYEQDIILGEIAAPAKASPIYPEFSVNWIIDEILHSPFEERANDQFYIRNDEEREEIVELCRYWQGRTVEDHVNSRLEEDQMKGSQMGKKIFQTNLHHYAGVGHLSIDYKKLMKIGYTGLIEIATRNLNNLDKKDPDYGEKRDFYQAMIIMHEAAKKYIGRYGKLAESLAEKEEDPKRKKELNTMALNCYQIAGGVPKTFWQALQLFNFATTLIQVESNGHSISYGRMDQWLSPYYEADMQKGTLTKAFALELLEVEFVKMNNPTKLKDKGTVLVRNGRGFGGESLTIGGVDQQGKDATNDLTMLILEGSAHTRMMNPWVCVRMHEDTPEELKIKTVECIRAGYGHPKIFNDGPTIKAMQRKGMTLEEARDYVVVGCVEPSLPGKEYGWHDAAYVNTPKMMEMVINGGRCLDCGPHCARWEVCGGQDKSIGPNTGSLETYQSFDEVLNSVDQQFDYWCDQMSSSLNIIDRAHRSLKPVPYVSAFFEECLASGKDLSEGGAKYNGVGPQASGIATCADTLATIKQLMFDEKRKTGGEILQAVKDNWAGHEQIYALVNSSKVHHYGNDDDYADELFKYMFECYCRNINGRKNIRGGEFSPGVYSVNANVAMGLSTNATPDGRKAGEPISDNMGPVHTDGGSHDIAGPTALVNSLTKVDHSLATNGTLMNLRFPEEAVAGEEGRDNLASFIDEYLAKQAMHVQFNIMSAETMKAAQKKPEDYKDMLVRVAGYSAYFVELGKPLQKDLIQRTELHF
ncbi:(2S)-3-sulfopropanediol dehydratase [Isachenkonia alkalipeptolytica]|uniref:Formate C-acetyltransferase/glycerol dehydratase family glycyl radical enzyme n=1 Tax=Isachenkonia alkalipeptolytica TaxID=2565777 RepID=A0AA44BED4_9CLOT|nr:formate C-acetyltransferase/glycerol dehydratase family glycyl radical enzyme [Isachenkonia alkalipeptolytica]NBG88857.1 formate C-acetyltransferase/glycerol dehydratase family glycyl radical enzyme [Isachenkonia alkalipeptolytica]